MPWVNGGGTRCQQAPARHLQCILCTMHVDKAWPWRSGCLHMTGPGPYTVAAQGFVRGLGWMLSGSRHVLGIGHLRKQPLQSASAIDP